MWSGSKPGPQPGNPESLLTLFARINRGFWPPKSHHSQQLTGQSSMERTPGDVCFKKSQGCYLKVSLIIKSYCTVSITIPILVMVKIQVLLCSGWSNIPTLTSKTHLASISSIFSNIHHLAQNKANTNYNGKCSQKELFTALGRHIRQIDKEFQITTSSSQWYPE